MKSLSRREFLGTAFAAGVAVSLGGAGSQGAASGRQAARPNIVFILADDYGLDGVGCYGSDRHKDRTPNIDALAPRRRPVRAVLLGAAVRTDAVRDHDRPLCLPDGRPDQSAPPDSPSRRMSTRWRGSSRRPATTPATWANGGRWARRRATGASASTSPTPRPAAGTGRRATRRTGNSSRPQEEIYYPDVYARVRRGFPAASRSERARPRASRSSFTTPRTWCTARSSARPTASRDETDRGDSLQRQRRLPRQAGGRAGGRDRPAGSAREHVDRLLGRQRHGGTAQHASAAGRSTA